MADLFTFGNDMKRFRFTLMLAVLTLFGGGCRSPMQKMLAQSPGWEQSAQRMASTTSSHTSGLVKVPFPDLNNPAHAKIWKALWKKGKVGLGFGSICDYYGFYLVTVSDSFDDSKLLSSFYDPTNHFVLNGTEGIAFSIYGGDKTATQTNVVALVQHLLAVSGDEAFVVNDSSDIPHTSYSKDNPELPFKELLSASGITISPPAFVKKNEEADKGYSHYSVFVYMPLGGRLFRYEVRCWRGRIDEVRRFLIDADIGDCSYIM